jgi:AraC-like DNA-binding protein
MRDNLGEELTIDDIAHAAMFSKFYFTRLFHRVTGMSPGRFLSAIRIQQATELLLSTSMTVTDVSYRVGYNSMGTFSSRFRESVGLSPTAYRQQRGLLGHLPGEVGSGEPDSRSATVGGRIFSPQADPVGAVFIGLFSDRLPHGRPIRWTLRPQPGTFQLDNVRPGSCYLVVDAPSSRHGEPPGSVTEPGSYVAVHGPIIVRRDTDIRLADLWLRPRSMFDPPILLARLDARSVTSRTAVATRDTVKFAA